MPKKDLFLKENSYVRLHNFYKLSNVTNFKFHIRPLDNKDWSFFSYLHLRSLALPGNNLSHPITRVLNLCSNQIQLRSTRRDCYLIDQCLYLQSANERRLFPVNLLHYFARMSDLCYLEFQTWLFAWWQLICEQKNR